MDEGFTVRDKRGVDGGGDTPQQPEQKQETKQINIVEQCFNADFLGPWIAAGVFPNKYVIDRKTGLVVDSEWSYADHDLPWIMVNNDGDRHCEFYKDVDKLYNIIPPPCMSCWKVVVVPKTIKQLLQLLQIETEMVKKDPYCFCKCGIELRQDVERNYGGYFYCNGPEQGLARLKQVRDNVLPVLGDDTVILLKRGCTELERKYGPSNKWDDIKEPYWDLLWEKLLAVFKVDKTFSHQPELIQRHIVMKWFGHATSIGDPTIPELNGGKKMYPGYVTYDYEEKENGN